MLIPLALVVSGIGQWIMLFVGLLVVGAIVYALMQALNSPPWMYKVAAVVGLLILLLIAIYFFFGDSAGSLRIHDGTIKTG